MTRILLASDNHGDKNILEKILRKEQYNFSIHLGDSLLPEEYIKGKFDKYVSGNNEWFSIAEDNFTIEGFNISILHGHTRGINMFDIVNGALSIAHSHNSSIVLFGHTHCPFSEITNGITIINPGALWGPRNNSKKGYAILVLDNGKIIETQFKNI
ncbi:YfcE family phosphodiesterase [Candidatus Mycoplasma mahonii]|uniref:YfcE family phosphodiesterase n=1 Tax=Candidatus Mycoplasma mahonii TaxID=3004105 RepID=UPI0026EEE6F4|nr:YfcE family phosphodiesterase [Candidatus Mycoplasma mahonii]WKX02498.1 YfcE family phosphodiesterase [Candidatus Mycoplasma mahonii]